MHKGNKVHSLAIHRDKPGSKAHKVRMVHKVRLLMVHIQFHTDHMAREYRDLKALSSHTVHNWVQRKVHRKVHMVHNVLVRRAHNVLVHRDHTAHKDQKDHRDHMAHIESHKLDTGWWKSKAAGNMRHLERTVRLGMVDKRRWACNLLAHSGSSNIPVVVVYQ